ncbi:MAG: PolC-type DNA polymerase III [Oscillospiraceae bacterium]|nr:PolC-type DNA polymerase III [Oscillospiraceae bacterium]
MTPVLLYEIFPFLQGAAKLTCDFSKVFVVRASINNAKTQMDIYLTVPSPIPPFEIDAMEKLIAKEYGIETVNISAAASADPSGGGERGGGHSSPVGDSRPASAGAVTATVGVKDTGSAKKNLKTGKAIMGRIVKTAPMPMSQITIDDGKVTVRGIVCANRCRLIEKNNSWLLSFDITDQTGTLTVYKFIPDEKAEKIANAIQIGMYLTVSGVLFISNYDGELTLNPHNIFESERALRMDTADADKTRVELHLHTKMSAKDGLIDVSELIGRAVAWGHPAIAITDHGVVHSFPEVEKAAGKYKGKIKIIYGMEGYLLSDMPEPLKKRRNNHVILLAQNKAGLKNLYKLVTHSHLHGFSKRPIIKKSELSQHREGLIIGAACERGELFEAVTRNKSDAELREIAAFYDYLEIQPLCNNMFMLFSEKPIAKSVEDLQNFNRKVIEIGNSLNIPTVATCDAHFLDPEDEIYRKIILTANGYKNANDDLALFYRTTDEMLREFSYLGADEAFKAVVTNTRKIAEMCEEISPLPQKHKLFSPQLEGSAIELEKLIIDGIAAHYGDDPPQIVTQRAEYELCDILKLNYDVIYMAAQKLVAYLKTKRNRVGSRGSVGSSFVAYLAGITEVNPLPAHYRCPNCKLSLFYDGSGAHHVASDQTISYYACGADMPDKACTHCGTMLIKDGFNIPFETFLGFGGEKVPDIDLNVSNQSAAHKFVYDMFGSDRVYRAGTIGTIAEKNAYRYVKGYLEATRKSTTKADEYRLAAGCTGVKMTTGQHPGGLIVIPQGMDVTDFSPAQHPADDSSDGIITLHFEYKYLEDNLIKLDILGHDNPGMLSMLEEMTGINADEIGLDDAGTMSIFSSTKSLGIDDDDIIIGKNGAIGIPEFGTPFVRQMLCDTNPKDFDTLVRISGYSHGEKVWLDNAKSLIDTKKATVAETISSRDDIMLYLISKGMAEKDAFVVSESVRKGKGLPGGVEADLLKRKIPPWYIDSCNKIKYLFPKAHAVAYVIMAFRIAWFKVNRPLEYYSAFFYRRSQSGHFDAHMMTGGIDSVRIKIHEIKSQAERTKRDDEILVTLESVYEFYLRGFGFAQIDLYKSDAERFLLCKVCDDSDTENAPTLLRPPFIAINGLGTAAAGELVKQRENHEFISIDDISAACSAVNKNHLVELKALGAFGNLPDTSQMSLF